MIYFPDDINFKELLNTIRELSWDVAKIFKSYNQEIKNSKKLNIKNLETGPVTEADIEINDLIKNTIKNKYPFQEWEFLSEEDKKTNKNRIFNSKWVWIIDPLDGTKDFIKDTGEYAMHLALTFEKEIVLGIVLIPQKNQLWISIKGEGSWFENEESLKEFPINKKNKHLNELKILTSKSHIHQKFYSLLEKIKPKEIQGMGSIGYKICSILRGDGDLYISYSLPDGSSPQDWDIAAPLGLIKEAGGHFTDINGKDLKFLKEGNYDQSGILIASMASNHLEICKKISKLINN